MYNLILNKKILFVGIILEMLNVLFPYSTSPIDAGLFHSLKVPNLQAYQSKQSGC